jgi:uncharacterized Tic20 family protein
MTQPIATPDRTSPQPPAAEPSQEDRLLAAASYVGYLAGFWLIVPIVVYVLKREKSRFVAFHALQAIIVHVLLVPIAIIGVLFGLVATFALAAATDAHGRDSSFGLLLVVPYLVGLLVPWGIHAVLSIVCAVRAMQGRAARFPVAAWLADRFLEGDKGAAGA